MKNKTFYNNLVKEIKEKPRLEKLKEYFNRTYLNNCKAEDKLINEMLLKRERISSIYTNKVNYKKYNPNNEFSLKQIVKLMKLNELEGRKEEKNYFSFDGELIEDTENKKESETNTISEKKILPKSKSDATLLDKHIEEINKKKESMLQERLQKLYAEKDIKQERYIKNKEKLNKKYEKELSKIKDQRDFKALKLKIRGIIKKYEKIECDKFKILTHTMNTKLDVFFNREIFYRRKVKYHDIFHFNKYELGMGHDPYKHIMPEVIDDNDALVMKKIFTELNEEEVQRFLKEPYEFIKNKKYFEVGHIENKNLKERFSNEEQEENKQMTKSKSQPMLLKSSLSQRITKPKPTIKIPRCAEPKNKLILDDSSSPFTSYRSNFTSTHKYFNNVEKYYNYEEKIANYINKKLNLKQTKNFPLNIQKDKEKAEGCSPLGFQIKNLIDKKYRQIFLDVYKCNPEFYHDNKIVPSKRLKEENLKKTLIRNNKQRLEEEQENRRKILDERQKEKEGNNLIREFSVRLEKELKKKSNK